MSDKFDIKRGETNTIRSNRPCKFIAKSSGGTIISIQLPIGTEVAVFLGNDDFDFDLDFSVKGNGGFNSRSAQ
jgi:hypothetical protein